MTNIYAYNGSIIGVGGAVGGSENCCCDQCGCTTMIYIWEILNCDGASFTFNGTVKIGKGGIKCYNDPDVVSANTSSLFFTQCSVYTQPILTIGCNSTNNGPSSISLSAGAGAEFINFDQNICCTGVLDATYDYNFPSQNFTAIITTSSEPCNCDGLSPPV